jgi:hypothetical protein
MQLQDGNNWIHKGNSLGPGVVMLLLCNRSTCLSSEVDFMLFFVPHNKFPCMNFMIEDVRGAYHSFVYLLVLVHQPRCKHMHSIMSACATAKWSRRTIPKLNFLELCNFARHHLNSRQLTALDCARCRWSLNQSLTVACIFVSPVR